MQDLGICVISQDTTSLQNEASSGHKNLRTIWKSGRRRLTRSSKNRLHYDLYLDVPLKPQASGVTETWKSTANVMLGGGTRSEEVGYRGRDPVVLLGSSFLCFLAVMMWAACHLFRKVRGLQEGMILQNRDLWFGFFGDNFVLTPFILDILGK